MIRLVSLLLSLAVLGGPMAGHSEDSGEDEKAGLFSIFRKKQPRNREANSALLVPEGSGITSADAEALLVLHNQARNQVGTPALAWSPEIAAYAQNRANAIAKSRQYPPRHLPAGKNPYGENLAASSSATGKWSAARLAQGWLDEREVFERIGSPHELDERVMANFAQVGHYTQMIWSGTRRFGAGLAIWEANGSVYTVLVCCYDPPGNIKAGSIH